MAFSPVRTIVVDPAGRVLSDTGEPDPNDLIQMGEGVAEGLEELATLARQAGYVASRFQRVGRAVSKFIGPLDRPMESCPAALSKNDLECPYADSACPVHGKKERR